MTTPLDVSAAVPGFVTPDVPHFSPIRGMHVIAQYSGEPDDLYVSAKEYHAALAELKALRAQLDAVREVTDEMLERAWQSANVEGIPERYDEWGTQLTAPNVGMIEREDLRKILYAALDAARREAL